MTADTTMRAWRLHEYGPPSKVLRLETAPTPAPEAGELLVRVAGVPFNLNDLERISGGNMMVRPAFPYAPGMEVLGEVVGAGAGAEDAIGRRVAATTKGAHGGFAEYAVCPAVSAFDVPESIPLPDAAAIYFPFHLAWIGLFDRAGLNPDLAGPLGMTLLQKLADPDAGIVLDSWIDANGLLGGDAGIHIP